MTAQQQRMLVLPVSNLIGSPASGEATTEYELIKVGHLTFPI